jgi:hypothetical protein
MLDELV